MMIIIEEKFNKNEMNLKYLRTFFIFRSISHFSSTHSNCNKFFKPYAVLLSSLSMFVFFLSRRCLMFFTILFPCCYSLLASRTQLHRALCSICDKHRNCRVSRSEERFPPLKFKLFTFNCSQCAITSTLNV